MKPNQLRAYLELTIAAGEPVCIVGRPGIGKTDIVRQACHNLQYEALICHPAVDDPIDYKGLPATVNNLAEFLPYGNLRRMLDADEPLVVFFDDLGQAAEGVQKALMQLLLSRSLNGQPVSEQTRFIAATNAKDHKAGVSGLLEPVKSRFTGIVELEADLGEWKEWAFRHGIEPIVIAFADFRPALFYDWKPTKDMTNSVQPRTLAALSRIVKMRPPAAIRFEAYKGSIGEAASEFLAFEQLEAALPAADDIFADPHTAKLPEKDRPDVCCALTSLLAYRVQHNTVPGFIDYIGRFDRAGLADYAVMAAKNVMMRDETLTRHREFIKWLAEHRELMA